MVLAVDWYLVLASRYVANVGTGAVRPVADGVGFRYSVALYAGHFSLQFRRQVLDCPALHVIDRLNTLPAQGTVWMFA